MKSSQIDRLNTALAGRYRIERELGEGGMATVYLCEDIKHKRNVALKLLKPELAAVLGAERFVQEITTTAALHLPTRHRPKTMRSDPANEFDTSVIADDICKAAAGFSPNKNSQENKLLSRP